MRQKKKNKNKNIKLKKNLMNNKRSNENYQVGSFLKKSRRTINITKKWQNARI